MSKISEFIMRQWLQIRGNAKWDVLSWFMLAIATGFFTWLRGCPAWQIVVVVGLFVLASIISYVWKTRWSKVSSIGLVVLAFSLFAVFMLTFHLKIENATPTQSQNLKISNSVQSPALQVGTASNVQQQIDYSSKTFQATAAGSLASMIAPGSTINTLIINGAAINSNPPNTELHEWITNFGNLLSAATNEITLTKKEVDSLISAVNDLDKKTADLEILPDGRVRFGGIIAGAPTVEAEAISNAYNELAFHNNPTQAFQSAQAGITALESSQRPHIFAQEVELTPRGVGDLYGLASYSLGLMNSNRMSKLYAEKAVEADPNTTNKLVLLYAAASYAYDCHIEGDLTNGYSSTQ